MSKVMIGIDVGTSGTKVIFVEENGTVLASKTVEYPFEAPRAGWVEQEPLDWFRAVIDALRELVADTDITDRFCGIGLSGQMHGLVALDKDMNVIRPAILWNDTRTAKQCEDITNAAGGPDGLLALTNNRMLPGYTGGKILWMRDEEPQNFERLHIVINPKDYIRYMLTGELATDVSDASGTGLFNVKERKFSDELLSKLGLSRDIFAPCLESHEIAGRITASIAEKTGLPVGLPVVAGGGDAVIQTTGTGLVKQGVLGVVIGTSGVVAMGLDGYKQNPEGKLQVFCNNAPHLWHAMGVTLSAGGSLRWFRDTLCSAESASARAAGRDVYDLLSENAGKAGGNIVFLPYISGERCPYSDPNARGTFFGLTLAHTHADITRAVIEGVTFSLKQVADLIIGMNGGGGNRVIASGGGAQSPVWRQIMADVFGLPVATVSGSGEGGAYGAALLAGVGCGVFGTIDEAISVLREETLTEPKDERRYAELYDIYTELYFALKPSFDAISKLD